MENNIEENTKVLPTKENKELFKKWNINDELFYPIALNVVGISRHEYLGLIGSVIVRYDDNILIEKLQLDMLLQYINSLEVYGVLVHDKFRITLIQFIKEQYQLSTKQLALLLNIKYDRFIHLYQDKEIQFTKSEYQSLIILAQLLTKHTEENVTK